MFTLSSSRLTCLAAILATLCFGSISFAELAIQPASVTTDFTPLANDNGDPNNVRDQSGLSLGYISGVTDFTTYTSSGVTHNGSLGNIFGSFETVTGNFDFDLGGFFSIQSIALWNFGNNSPSNVVGFTLFADDNNSFSSPVNLGSFTADPNLGPVTAVGAEVFAFADTIARFVRLEVTSNNGGANSIVGEVAFEGQAAIPEASSFLGLSAVAAFLSLRRSRR